MQPAPSDSVASGESSSRRLRADISDTYSVLSGNTQVGSRGSRLLQTDSMENTPSSATPALTPQASGTLLSQESASDTGRDDDDEDDSDDSDIEAKVLRGVSLQTTQILVAMMES